MKFFICVVLAAVLLVQFSDALPRPEALRSPRSVYFKETDDMTEYEKYVITYGVTELITFGRTTVEIHKTFFDKVIKQLEESHPEMSEELRELKEFSEAADDLHGEPSQEYFFKVFALSDRANEIRDKYDLDEVKNPTDEQRTMARLFDENGLFGMQLAYLQRVNIMRHHFDDHFQPYVNSLTDEEKQKHRKFVDWFIKFRSEMDLLKNIKIMFEFYDLLRS